MKDIRNKQERGNFAEGKVKMRRYSQGTRKEFDIYSGGGKVAEGGRPSFKENPSRKF